MLSLYTEQFCSVEVNNTFYRLPAKESVIAWRDSSPPGFLFAVKGSRFLTHMKKLRDTERGLDRFFERADLLKSKLGPILFQLPPFWKLNLEALESFLEALPSHHRYAFEFREPSWNDPRVLDLLRSFKIAYCIFELSKFQSPIEVTTDFAYIRLHGPQQKKYVGSYKDQVLRAWARRIHDWNLPEVFVYFDNTFKGDAAKDALRLKELLGP